MAWWDSEKGRGPPTGQSHSSRGGLYRRAASLAVHIPVPKNGIEVLRTAWTSQYDSKTVNATLDT
jgi:hypothetical protein